MGKALTSIGKYAFAGCTQLRELEIPEGVIYLGEGVFASCQSLQSATIPAGLNHAISSSHTSSEGTILSQFFGCSGLKKVTIMIPSITSSHTSWINDESLQTTGITEIIFSEGVTKIGDSTFRDCSNLKTLDFPESLTEIGSNAFWGCHGLQAINFPGKLSAIGSSTFRECAGLETLELPASITTIRDHVFRDCSK